MTPDARWLPFGAGGDVAGPQSAQPVAAVEPGILLGLTGERRVGKSTLTDMLCKEYGFVRAHAFEGGKYGAETIFAHMLQGLVSNPHDVAYAMVHGHLKDKPSPYLPGGVAPRWFLERFGHFMGVTLGTAWTMEAEVARVRRLFPGKPIVVESLVYEETCFRGLGGLVVRVERLGHTDRPEVDSDAVQAAIKADFLITQSTVAELLLKGRAVVEMIREGFTTSAPPRQERVHVNGADITRGMSEDEERHYWNCCR
ncbi:hypothetical protein [Rhizobium phage RHph_X2_26]|nr:hypothetical protein [Rhizobium phage RHph_X2_26]